MSSMGSLPKKPARPLLLVAVLAAVVVVPSGAFLASEGLTHASLSSVGGVPVGSSAVPALAAHGSPNDIRSTLLSEIPARLSSTPWVASLSGHGPALKPLTSLPNLALLTHGVPKNANGTVSPFYQQQPAPMGLADYGLGATAYSYNVTNLMGAVTFNAPPNVTDPASTGVIEPAGQHDGNVGSVYEFGIQLNTVATNMSIPGSDQGFFWTQNVVNWNDTGIHFVDDTFNLTSATQNPFRVAPGTIYSACGLNSTGVQTVLTVYGGVFQCVGGTIPLTPASYPVSIQLYNNASVNAQNMTQVAYGYRIDMVGTHTVFTGVSDTVVFNNPNASSGRPANRPGFSIDGFAGAPAGLFRDAEMVLVGDIGGDNSVFRSINGTVQLEYANHTLWRSVPSAYDWGGNTGETSSGIAVTWSSPHTEVIHQGPTFLCGLWGAVPGVSVRSGSLHLAGTISPNYGFVFVSNTKPVADPFVVNSTGSNLSWLPTNDKGAFNTWLPPTGAPWTTRYHVQAWAAGFAEFNGTPLKFSDAHYRITMTSAPGNLQAPLYAFGNVQAKALANAVIRPHAPAPYTFRNLVDNLNYTFDHLNDYAYPDFVLFMTQGVTTPMVVSNVTEGTDSPAGPFYFYDFNFGGSTGILTPGPSFVGPLPFFTSGINIYGGHDDVITDQTTAAAGYGLQVVLWGDTAAKVFDITSMFESAGVWVGESTDTQVWNVTATTGGNCLTDMASVRTVGYNLVANGTFGGFIPSLGVNAYSSIDPTFSQVTATAGAYGFLVGEDYGAGAAYDPYYYLPGSIGLTASHVAATDGGIAGNISLSTGTTLSRVSATAFSVGFILDESPATVTDLRAVNNSYGLEIIHTNGSTVKSVDAAQSSTGVVLYGSENVAVSQVVDSVHSTGVEVLDSSAVTITGVLAVRYSLGVYVFNSTNVVISKITTRDHSTAVVVG
jgi:hypothetical protein